MAKSPPFPARLWWFTTLVFVASLAAATALTFRHGLPDAMPLLLFGFLVVFARNRDVALPGEVKVAATTMILMAAVVVFAARDVPAGAVVVAMLAGFYAPSFSRAAWGWMPFNSGTQGLAVTSAVLVYAALLHRFSTTTPVAAVPLVAAIAVFLVVEQSIVFASFLVETGSIPGDLITGRPQYLLELLPFAVLGYVLGRMYLALGPTVVVLMVAPIVIAREMFASYMRVKESHEETVGMLIRALERKDHYTAGHAERVATYALYMGEELNFMPTRLERLRFAALMHDIGKLVVPNTLLNKPGRLTEEEFAKVRIHEKVSVQMLSHIDFLRPIAAASHSDHTHFDPDDPDHPIEPYIVMIADAYDAMTSTRAYRKALPQDVAFQELRDKAGVQFHPACVEALIRSIENRGEKHGDGFEQASEFEHAPVAGLGSAGLGDLMPTDA